MKSAHRYRRARPSGTDRREKRVALKTRRISMADTREENGLGRSMLVPTTAQCTLGRLWPTPAILAARRELSHGGLEANADPDDRGVPPEQSRPHSVRSCSQIWSCRCVQRTSPQSRAAASSPRGEGRCQAASDSSISSSVGVALSDEARCALARYSDGRCRSTCGKCA